MLPIAALFVRGVTEDLAASALPGARVRPAGGTVAQPAASRRARHRLASALRRTAAWLEPLAD
jgi:hypothetical protein